MIKDLKKSFSLWPLYGKFLIVLCLILNILFVVLLFLNNYFDILISEANIQLNEKAETLKIMSKELELIQKQTGDICNLIKLEEKKRTFLSSKLLPFICCNYINPAIQGLNFFGSVGANSMNIFAISSVSISTISAGIGHLYLSCYEYSIINDVISSTHRVVDSLMLPRGKAYIDILVKLYESKTDNTFFLGFAALCDVQDAFHYFGVFCQNKSYYGSTFLQLGPFKFSFYGPSISFDTWNFHYDVIRRSIESMLIYGAYLQSNLSAIKR